MMKSEMIAEFKLLQKSRTYKVTDEWTGKLIQSVKYVQKRLTNGIAKEGQMMAMLDQKLKFLVLKNKALSFK
ncbi:hypothetical protein ABIB40_003516 [Pedobacter sp. UYP30]|uniref:hypothetical protein n=1 Tax=Pedobacter sp. UYP30 TaxID=1756400 RepID=UPI003398D60D